MIYLLNMVIYDDLPSKKWWFMMIYIFEMVISIPKCEFAKGSVGKHNSNFTPIYGNEKPTTSIHQL